MAITLDLEPEVEARLRNQAQAHGLDLVEYVRLLVESERVVPVPLASREEFRQAWRKFCEPISDLPLLGPEAFTRESFYAGHD